MSEATTRPVERHDRLLRERVHDPYHAKCKLAKVNVCPECRAVYQNGRWQWVEICSPCTLKTVCPACLRIHDQCPAGFLTLSGKFLAKHMDEIRHLLDHVEEREKADHPLKRMMGVESLADGGLVVTYTDPHLARAAGEALHHAYKGKLDYDYQEGEFLLRVNWRR